MFVKKCLVEVMVVTRTYGLFYCYPVFLYNLQTYLSYFSRKLSSSRSMQMILSVLKIFQWLDLIMYITLVVPVALYSDDCFLREVLEH